MTAAASPGAKRPAEEPLSTERKRRYFSLEPDLDVHVGGEVFQCFAVDLMRASPVIRQMLLSDMHESQQGCINLEGDPNEFRELLRHLDIFGGKAPPDPTDETISKLLQWTNEYQFEPLHNRLEESLLVQRTLHESGVFKALTEALLLNLPRRRKQCLDVIEKTVGNFQQSGFGPSALARQQQFMEKLSEFIEEPLVMEPLWPVIFRVAGAKASGCHSGMC